MLIVILQNTNPHEQPPNKAHLHEMGLLINPDKDKWFQDRKRQEKLEKRREYNKYLVRVTSSCDCVTT